MTLKESIKEDMKAAFKAGDQTTRGTLSLLLSVIQNRELAKRAKLGADKSELTDEEVQDAIGSELKKRRESMATFVQGGRPELAEIEKAEAAVLARYQPEQMSEDQVRGLIKEAISATSAGGGKDMGKVMGALAPKIKGRFDGGRANAMVKEALGA